VVSLLAVVDGADPHFAVLDDSKKRKSGEVS
jgi:hypothetical protein